MNIKKIIFPAVLAATIGGVTLVGASSVRAETTPATNPLTELVQRIAQKFGLNQTQVQTEVDQFQTQRRNERQTMMQTRHKERLSQLIETGKITQTQADALTAKMVAHRTEMETWAKDQGIDLESLKFGGMKGMGMRGGW